MGENPCHDLFVKRVVRTQDGVHRNGECNDEDDHCAYETQQFLYHLSQHRNHHSERLKNRPITNDLIGKHHESESAENSGRFVAFDAIAMLKTESDEVSNE